MAGCDYGPLILAVAGIIVAATPGVVAWSKSQENSKRIDRLPGKRAADHPPANGGTLNGSP